MVFDEERPVEGVPGEAENSRGELFESRDPVINHELSGEDTLSNEEQENFEGRPIEERSPETENIKEDASNGFSGEDGSGTVPGDGGTKAMGFLEIIYGMIVEPKATLRYLSTARTFLPALAFVVILALFNALVGIGEMKEIPELARLPVDISSFLGPIALLAVFLALIGWFVDVAAVSLFAQLLGGAGNGRALLSGYAFASLPMLIAAILEFLLNALGLEGFFSGLVSLAGFIWTLVLQVWAVREIEQVSLGRAILAYCAFPLIILFMILTLVVFAIIALAPVMDQLSTFPIR